MLRKVCLNSDRRVRQPNDVPGYVRDNDGLKKVSVPKLFDELFAVPS